jgi:V-type H+-transporting ATPase subunit H
LETALTAAAAAGGATGAGTAVIDPAAKTVLVFLDWIVAQIRRASHPTQSVPVAVASLASLLREPAVRGAALRAGAVPALAGLVVLPPGGGIMNVQLLYEAILCVWQLSFLPEAAEALGRTGVVGGLADVVRLAQKEKLVRVALLALRNLLAAGTPSLEFAVVEKGLPRAVSTRLEQTWDDEDVPQLLEWMAAHLEEGVLSLSSFDMYSRQLQTGDRLTWAPLHDQPQFWAENASRLADANCALLRALLRLLDPRSGADSTTMAVACRDIGQFVTYCPHGRGILADLEAKEAVMRLVGHPEREVQHEALVCVQKMLLSRDRVAFLGTGV